MLCPCLPTYNLTFCNKTDFISSCNSIIKGNFGHCSATETLHIYTKRRISWITTLNFIVFFLFIACWQQQSPSGFVHFLKHSLSKYRRKDSLALIYCERSDVGGLLGSDAELWLFCSLIKHAERCLSHLLIPRPSHVSSSLCLSVLLCLHVLLFDIAVSHSLSLCSRSGKQKNLQETKALHYFNTVSIFTVNVLA